MKNQALFPSKDNSKKFKCRLLQFLFGALRVTLSAKYKDLVRTFEIVALSFLYLIILLLKLESWLLLSDQRKFLCFPS